MDQVHKSRGICTQSEIGDMHATDTVACYQPWDLVTIRWVMVKVLSGNRVNRAGGWHVKSANLCGCFLNIPSPHDVHQKHGRGWKQGTSAERKVTDAGESKLLVSALFPT